LTRRAAGDRRRGDLALPEYSKYFTYEHALFMMKMERIAGQKKSDCEINEFDRDTRK